MNYLEKQQKYIGFIAKALENRNIDTEDNEWKESTLFKNLIYSTNTFSILSSVALNMGISELLLIVRVKNLDSSKSEWPELFAEEVKKMNIENLDNYGTINIIWIINDIQCKLGLQHNYFSVTNKLKSLKIFKKGAKFLSSFYIDKDPYTREISIKHTHRPEMLLLPPIIQNSNIQTNDEEEKESLLLKYPDNLKGYVLTVNLIDIVTIYNQIGDVLFKDNVRFGISEQLGVDRAIKDTLKIDPEYFWFRNNGITMLVEKPDIILDKTNEIVLKKQEDLRIKFSVINGAQTITAAAEYFYSTEARINELAKKKAPEYEKEMKLFEKSKNAKVILRIIQITADKIPGEAKKISIALNRQKPIKTEDIAFTNSFVEKLNNYLEYNNIGFTIAKRNETSYTQNEYSLIEFARARKAIAGLPGDARNKDALTLLRLGEITEEQPVQMFSDAGIFVKEWYAAPERTDEEHEVFNKYYKPVLFALKLAKLYEMNSAAILDDRSSATNIIIKYGKWYFVAFVIYMMNGNDTDYSSFSYKNFKTDEIKSLMLQFAQYCSKLFQDNIDSNTFKRNTEYDNLKQSNYKRSDLYKRLYFVQYNEVATSASDAMIPSPRRIVKVSSTEIFKNKKDVVNASQAFVFSVVECIKYAKRKGKNLNEYIKNSTCISLERKDRSYFRNCEEVLIEGTTYYIGKNHDFQTKCALIDNLCHDIGLPAKSIVWKDHAVTVYSNK